MAKVKSRNSKFFVIIIIFLSLFFLLIVGLNVFFLIKMDRMKLDIKMYNETKKMDKQALDIIIDEHNKIKSELEVLSNIGQNIEETKLELFKNVKQLEDKILNGTSNKKIAYITFDDGPYYLTHSVLQVLRDNNVKATFFTIGRDKDTCYDNRAAECASMYKKIVDEGHTIANHTYSHLIRGGLYSSVNSFITSLVQQENLIKDRTGVITNIMRFPGGSGTAGSLKNGIISSIRTRGYGWVDWTALDGDGGALGSASQAMSTLTNSIDSNIEVVLLHDYSYITYSQLQNIINYLRGQGYILLPLFYESNMINK